MAALLEVHGIVTRFGSQTVHAGLDMRVEQGEVFGIIGGSGSGKSVLLRIILGLLKPNEGTVRFLGQELGSLDAAELHRLKASYGVTFQQGALLSSLSVQQNVQVPMLEHLRLSERALDGLALLKLQLVGLPLDAAAKYPAQLSGGMTKRAALARALALDPLLLFLDEPTTGLDPIGAAAFDQLLIYLHRELKLTVVMITHDLDTIFRTCSRVGVIVEGRMIMDSLERIVHNPHPWIQAYFGGARGRARIGRSDGA